MNYIEIAKAIEDFDSMTSEEIQNNIKPIIKSYSKEFLSEYLGVSKENLYRMCKSLFVRNNEKIRFTTYIKIMSLGINPKYNGKRFYKLRKTSVQKSTGNNNDIVHLRTRKTPEEIKAKQKEYQHRYYVEVTKKKRAQKQMETTKK